MCSDCFSKRCNEHLEEQLGKIELNLSEYTDKWHPTYEHITVNIYFQF